MAGPVREDVGVEARLGDADLLLDRLRERLVRRVPRGRADAREIPLEDLRERGVEERLARRGEERDLRGRLRREAGALGACLSGSGSTIVAFVDSMAAIARVEAALTAAAADSDLPGRIEVVAPRDRGASVVPD